MERSFNDTICAPATVPGTGAISLIRISGAQALGVTDKLVEFRKGNAATTPAGRVKFGTIQSTDGQILDEVLCNIYRAPHSYTGEDSVEIMCHASSYIVTEILSRLITLGCRMAEHGEFTQRAFLAGKMDLAQAEAVADLIASSTESAHRLAMNQLKGGISGELAEIREQMLQMTSLLELELDFSEEDVEFADRKQLTSLLDKAMTHIDRLAASFRLGNAIKNGIPVAIVGEPNSGKSTLLNCILGEQRAIVSDIAGTTRDTIEETFNVDGVLFRFIDTAGIRNQSEDQIEIIGIEKAFKSVRGADIVILVVDGTSGVGSIGGEIGEGASGCEVGGALRDILSAIDFEEQRLIVAVNKCDRTAGSAVCTAAVERVIRPYLANEGVEDVLLETHLSFAGISALDGTGIDALLHEMAQTEKYTLNDRSSEGVLVANMRHYQALTTAHHALSQAAIGLENGAPTDLVAEDLRSAITSLGTITGMGIDHTEVLQNIFGRFCIGK